MNIGDSLKNQIDKVKESAAQVKEITGTITEKVSELKQAGVDLVKSSLEELAIAQPTVEKAGFKVHDISIGIGIPPEISISFSIKQPVDLQELRVFRDENQDKKLVAALVTALINAYEISEKFPMKKFTFTGVGIKLGIPPDVSLRYS